MIKQVWNRSRLFVNSIAQDGVDIKCYGGFCIIVAPRLVTYVQDVSSDTYSRYVAVTCGKNKGATKETDHYSFSL